MMTLLKFREIPQQLKKKMCLQVLTAFPFFFYDKDSAQSSVDSNLLFMIQEEINVFSGMKTDTWQGKAAYFSGADENKTLKITAEMVENWRSSTFYVGTHGNWQANDNNTGSYFAPLATLQKAVEKIKSSEERGPKADGYTICVSGTVNGSADFSSFSGLSSSVKVKIKAFSGSGVSAAKATIKTQTEA